MRRAEWAGEFAPPRGDSAPDIAAPRRTGKASALHRSRIGRTEGT